MAIALGTNGPQTNSGTANPVTVAFNNAAGNFIAFGLFYDKNATITSVTYAGATATVAGTVTMTGWVYKVSICYIHAPATGSNNWVVNFSGSTAGAVCVNQAVSYTGVATSSAVDSTTTNYVTGATNVCNATLSPGTSTGWMVAFGCQSGGTTISAGTNTTLRTGFATFGGSMMDTNGTIASGSQTIGYTGSTNFNSTEGAAIAAFSFKAPASGPTNLKSLSGNVKANIKSFSGNTIGNMKSISGNS